MYWRRSPDFADEGGDVTTEKYEMEYNYNINVLKRMPAETVDDCKRIAVKVSQLIITSKKILNIDNTWKPFYEHGRIAYKNKEMLIDAFQWYGVKHDADPLTMPFDFVKDHAGCAPFDPKSWSNRYYEEEAFHPCCGSTCACSCHCRHYY